MDPKTAALIDLQEADKVLARLESDQREKPRALEARRRELQQAEAQVWAANQQVREFQTRAKQRELDLRAQEERIVTLRVQLNDITENDAYRTMLHEIKVAEEKREEIETSVLVAYDDVTAAKEDVAGREEALGVQREEVERHAAEVEQALRALEGEIRSARARRDEVSALADTDARARYERLNRSHPGSALVPVVNGACTGCFTGLTSNVQAILIGQRDIVQCPSCGRMLYLGDDTTAETLNTGRHIHPLS